MIYRRIIPLFLAAITLLSTVSCGKILSKGETDEIFVFSSKEPSDSFYKDGKRAYAEEKYKEALYCFQKSLEKAENAASYIAIANTYVKMDEVDAAVELLSKAVSKGYTDDDTIAAVSLVMDAVQTENKGVAISKIVGQSTDEKLTSLIGEYSDGTVSFTNPDFESLVRKMLNKSSDEVITKEELNKVTEITIAGDSFASSNLELETDELTKLAYSATDDRYKYFVNKRRQSYKGTTPMDISDLKLFPNLESVTFYITYIEDFSVLGELKNLKEASFVMANLKSLYGIEKAENLESLSLQYNKIEDITFISNMTNLKKLSLYKNPIEDVSMLGNMRDLEVLLLDSTNVLDISCLSNCEKLAYASFYETRVRDYTSVENVPSLVKAILYDDNIYNSVNIEDYCADLCRAIDIDIPEYASTKGTPIYDLVKNNTTNGKVDKMVIYNTDAVGSWLLQEYTDTFEKVLLHTQIAMPVMTTSPSVTRAAFTTMYTGADEVTTQIVEWSYDKTLYTFTDNKTVPIESFFDTALRAGKKILMASGGGTLGYAFADRPFTANVYALENQNRDTIVDAIKKDKYDIIICMASSYDTSMHTNSTSSVYTQQVLTDEVGYFADIAAAAENYYAAKGYTTLIGFQADHGCHTAYTSSTAYRGKHGADAKDTDIPEDRNTTYYYGIIPPKK